MGRPPAGELFIPLSCNFDSDPKTVAVKLEARWLYIRMALLCKRTDSDGVITREQIAEFKVPRWEQHLAELMEGKGCRPDQEALVVPLPLTDGFYVLPGYVKRNKTKQQRADERDADRDRKANGKAAKSDA